MYYVGVEQALDQAARCHQHPVSRLSFLLRFLWLCWGHLFWSLGLLLLLVLLLLPLQLQLQLVLPQQALHHGLDLIFLLLFPGLVFHGLLQQGLEGLGIQRPFVGLRALEARHFHSWRGGAGVFRLWWRNTSFLSGAQGPLASRPVVILNHFQLEPQRL
jgi:hypothetical protein